MVVDEKEKVKIVVKAQCMLDLLCGHQDGRSLARWFRLTVRLTTISVWYTGAAGLYRGHSTMSAKRVLKSRRHEPQFLSVSLLLV